MKEQDQGDPGLSPTHRSFVEGCGRYVAVVPPILTFLLSTTMTSGAIAHSNNGIGNGGGDGAPGNSGKQDINR
jgi:hypothetical protein